MKLVDVVRDIKIIDADLIIFQNNRVDVDSDVMLFPAEDGDQGVKIQNGTKYVYLIEVFLAREFIEDWIRSLDRSPDDHETAKRLFEYAVNDA